MMFGFHVANTTPPVPLYEMYCMYMSTWKHTVGEINIEHVSIFFFSKFISNEDIHMKISPELCNKSKKFTHIKESKH